MTVDGKPFEEWAFSRINELRRRLVEEASNARAQIRLLEFRVADLEARLTDGTKAGDFMKPNPWDHRTDEQKQADSNAIPPKEVPMAKNFGKEYPERR